MTTLLIIAAFSGIYGILNRRRQPVSMARMPLMMLAGGAGLGFVFFLGAQIVAVSSNVNVAGFPPQLIARGAEILLGALAFAAATQFRVSELPRICPASFRLTMGGAPLFLVICGLAGFILAPQLSLSGAFLLAAALTLNGAAFNRRAVTDAPTPQIIKGAVRLESAAILALGLPIAVIMESLATTPPMGLPAITPLYQTTNAITGAFAIGGSLGLVAAILDNSLRIRNKTVLLAVSSSIVAMVIADFIGASISIAALSAGLIWGQETQAPIASRVRIRREIETFVGPIAYLAFGMFMAPRLLQADLLSIVFALSAVTIMRAGPRLAALSRSSLPKESQFFLAWFGGAPGAASALFILSLFDASLVTAQDSVLSVGALAVLFGILAARLTSRPLVKAFLKQSALARRKAMFAS